MTSKLSALFLGIIAICATVLCFVGLENLPQKQEASKARWEYKCFELYPETVDTFLHTSLKQMGELGFELVALHDVTVTVPNVSAKVTRLEVVFKRPLSKRTKEEEFKENEQILQIIQAR